MSHHPMVEVRFRHAHSGSMALSNTARPSSLGSSTVPHYFRQYRMVRIRLPTGAFVAGQDAE
jgi:hypothetical protein